MENGEPTHTPSNSHSHSHNYFKELFDTKRYNHNNKLMLASIILFFIIIILILFIHIYARCYLRRARRRHLQRHHSDDSLVFYIDPNDPSTLLTTLPSATGLTASLIAMLPVFGYFPNTDPPENPLECAVCLSDFREGEIGRVLPKCHHAFHIDCIDMWFRSHITCPLCRAPVEAPPEPDNVFDISDLLRSSEENRTGSEETKPSFLEDIIIEFPFRTSEGSVGDSPSTLSSSSSFSVTRILPPFDGILGKDWRGSGSPSFGGGGDGGCSGSDDELNGGQDETQRVGSEVTRGECDDVAIVEPKS